MAVRAEDLDMGSELEVMPTFTPEEEVTEDSVIRRMPDGSIEVIPLEMLEAMEAEALHKVAPEAWNENLASKLDPNQRMQIADELIEYMETDERSRAMHMSRMADALTLMGLTDIPTGDVPFDGAATVTHPLIAEACTQFQARAIEELFPAGGPIKAVVIGKKTEEREEQAHRVETFMNYQLTEEDEDHFWNKDQMLFYLPLAGSAFMKAHIDPISGMAVSRFVKSEDFIVPYHAKSLRAAPRYCHRYPMWSNDVRRAQVAGTFIEDARLVATPALVRDDTHIQSRRESMEDIADDRTPTQHYDDTVYQIIEYHIDYCMPWDDEDGIAPPYIVTVEKESREVLAVRRNWKHDDETLRKRLWFAHYKYLPGLGFYGIGVLHTIGSLAKAASGSMRALLDAAAFSNFQGGFKAKSGASISGEMRLVPGEWRDVDASFEELSKMFYTPPFKEPSPALAKMLEVMIGEGRRFLTTTEMQVGDGNNTGPVGTTLALIEQSGKVFSAIHKRCHKAAREEFRMLGELNHEFAKQERYPYEVEGDESEILREDFDGRVDIIPVSDPNIWSSTQRIAQSQAVLELINQDPQLYGEEQRRTAHRRILSALRVPEPDEILPETTKARLDPVTENQNFLFGKPARAYYEQDHDAHMAVHMNFVQRMAGMAPELVEMIEPALRAHMAEHTAMKYRQEIEQELGMPLFPYDPHGQITEAELPSDVENMLSAAVAQRMAPPPPPPEEEKPDDEDEKDARIIADLERKAAEAEADAAMKADSFEADQRRKQQAFEAEQARKDEMAAREARRRRLAAGEREKPTGKPPGKKPSGKR